MSDLQEAMSRKTKLEEDLTNLVKAYQEETGLCVSDISLDGCATGAIGLPDGWLLSRVVVRVELP
jgi:hypothetical protein